MTKTFTTITLTAYLLSASSCFIFQKKERYGCPASGSNIGAEKLAAGDNKALRSSSKAHYKGKRSF